MLHAKFKKKLKSVLSPLKKTRGVKHRTTFNYTLIFADVFKFVKGLVYCTRYYFEKKLFSLIFEKTIDLPRK